jgi:ATP-dependent Clp protease ATP-binding subunit ClpC
VFERFTEHARQVVALAQDEARALKHGYIGTEHLLLALLRDQESLAGEALASLGVRLEEVRGQVGRIVGSGDEAVTRHVPFTPRSKKVLDLSAREANQLGHNFVGPEHILLGLARENEGVAARILLDLGAGADDVRLAVSEALAKGPPLRDLGLPAPGDCRRITISDGAVRWVAANAAVITAAGTFAIGILVGWLIWG